MSKLAHFLTRFGPEYSKWLEAHDQETAKAERDRLRLLVSRLKVESHKKVFLDLISELESGKLD